jgi:eukaryotic translation initiation factor 2C
MKEVDARILPAPPLYGKENSEIRPSNGAFDFSKIPQKFFKPMALVGWSVAVFSDSRRIPQDGVIRFLQELFQACRAKGMAVADKNFTEYIIYQDRMTVEKTLQTANERAVAGTDKSNAQMIFCILDKQFNSYEAIKLAAETEIGVMTQCFKSDHIFRSKPGVTTNLALKINAKLGGVNVVVDPKKFLNVLGQPIPTMIMGADVTHPPAGAGAGNGVSIAAVTATIDSK